MSTDKLIVFVPGIPVSQGSKRAVKPKGAKFARVIDVNPGKLKPWREACHDAFAYAGKINKIHKWDCPVGFSATFWFPPQQYNLLKDGNVKQRYALTKYDMDKLIRAIWDSLTSAEVIQDDSRICCIESTHKMICNRGQRPGVEVTIWKLPALQPGELPSAVHHTREGGAHNGQSSQEASREEAG